jgi:geranylgeranyl transferase type-1 subunit beta
MMIIYFKLILLLDIYHSYLGLAALAIMKESGLKPFDSALCVGAQQKEMMELLREAALSR